MITINNVVFVSTEEWKQTLLTVILVVYPHQLCSIWPSHFLKYDYKNQGDTWIQGCVSASPRPYGQSEENLMVSAGTE